MSLTTSRDIPSAEVDAWTTAEGRKSGRPMLLRFRPGLKSFLGDPRFSRRLQITWVFGDHNSSGMPSGEDSEAMGPLEDRLVEALEAEKAGILAFVHTYGGTRQWHFYISESADLGAVINDALAELPRLPISLEVEDDPEWREMAKVLGAVRE